MIAILFLACTQKEPYFVQEKQWYEQYQEAEQALEKQDFMVASSLLEDLYKATQSRAVLETLSDVYLQKGDAEKSYTLVHSYLEKHPGDTALRLMEAKTLLEGKRWKEAKLDLELVLHNQKMSIFEILEDPIIQKYKTEPEMKDILGFPLLTVSYDTEPISVLVGDIVLFSLKMVHLSSCEPSIRTGTTDIVNITKMTVLQKTKNRWQTETTLQINWRANRKGEIASQEYQINCGAEEAQFSLPLITIDEIRPQGDVLFSKQPFLFFPQKENLSDKGEISVQFRKNGIVTEEKFLSIKSESASSD